MSIPPPPGPQQPQDPYAAPTPPQGPYPQAPYGPQPYGSQPYGPQGPGPYPPSPYGGPPYATWGQGYSPFTRPSPVNGVAIAALVLGVLCFLPAVGLILGIVALVQIRRRGERGKGMAVTGAVLSSVGLALWALMLATSAGTDFWEGFEEGVAESSFSLDRGDCFDVPGPGFDEDVYDVDEVPCAGEHEGEVFAVVPVTGRDFPGDDRVTALAEDKCWTLRSAYAMDTWALGEDVDVYYLVPTADSWDWGDHEVTCVFASVDESGTLTGSLRADASTLNADQVAFLDAMNAVDAVLDREPQDYPEDDLAVNKDWAADVRDAFGEQAAALRAHTWPGTTAKSVEALAAEMEDIGEDWGKAATARDVDRFYTYYDRGYESVDGKTTVTARKALGLATTPPVYDEGSGGEGSGGSGRLDV
ncbi:DUF4190 domain-containing protein [Streptomyces antibioticus]|uniref:DUF4190 domain-containing protein n=1 Tax=Streptomyces antibioticus TaxID=1890 RepID=UPI00368EC356